MFRAISIPEKLAGHPQVGRGFGQVLSDWTFDPIRERSERASATDRSTDPFLRSYLWAYPAGIDWFATLADTADEATIGRVLRGTFEQPLSPTDLAELWPAGPAIGGQQ